VAGERLTAAVLIGETGPQLAELFGAAGVARIESAASMDEAVRRATRFAREVAPAVVLLSPAAASFDMFRDYEARGVAFKAAVAVVAAAEAVDGRETQP
jgi:UDP-N-acetylmuramoylalanine--D-glutamate ligase